MTPQRSMHDGQRFGTWTVLIAYPDESCPGRKRNHAWCVCDCGTQRMIFRPMLVAGRTQSCRACWQASVSIVGEVRKGWRIVASSRDVRTWECTGCACRKGAVTRSGPPPPCTACDPTYRPRSRANAKRLGISREAISRRIQRGWDVLDAVTKPRLTQSRATAMHVHAVIPSHARAWQRPKSTSKNS